MVEDKKLSPVKVPQPLPPPKVQTQKPKLNMQKSHSDGELLEDEPSKPPNSTKVCIIFSKFYGKVGIIFRKGDSLHNVELSGKCKHTMGPITYILPKALVRKNLGILTEVFSNVSLPNSLVTHYRSLR